MGTDFDALLYRWGLQHRIMRRKTRRVEHLRNNWYWDNPLLLKVDSKHIAKLKKQIKGRTVRVTRQLLELERKFYE